MKRYLKMGMLTLFFALTITACKQDTCKFEHPEWLYGRWKVFHIDMGGTQIGGPGFNGTEYTFLESGIVKTESPKGDTASVRFEYQCDTLIYLTGQSKEYYSVDSLTQDRLRLGYMNEGVPSIVDFLRMQ